MEKRKQLIALASAALVVLGGGAAFLLTRGHDEADTAQQSNVAPPPTPPGRPGMAAGRQGLQPGANGAPALKPGAKTPTTAKGTKPGGTKPVAGRDPFGKPAAGTAANAIALNGAPGAPGAPGLPAIKGPRNIKTRIDPFFVDWKVKPLPPYVFQDVEPIRLAAQDVVIPPSRPVEVRELPNRRVSGIMTGQGAYAILENGGPDAEIVKPGSVTSDGYRVVSINESSVKLQKKVENYIYTQIVPLSDAPVGPRTAGFPGGGAGFPGPGGVGGTTGGPAAAGGRPGFPGRGAGGAPAAD